MNSDIFDEKFFFSDNKICRSFEEKVLLGLKKCGISLGNPKKMDFAASFRLGAAVSGGADSTALLLALAKISKKYSFPLFVISVNHFIRADEESCGDIEFVRKLCLALKNAGFDLTFSEHKLERGEIADYCQENKTSVEDAARTARYQAFEAFIKRNELTALALAHNQNDQLETALMRILKGDSLEQLSYIPQVRASFIRPLLDISRKEIEEYLKECRISWRTDSTNFDTNYLRNKIRHKLMPLLDEEFDGWRKGLLKGVDKSLQQRHFIDEQTKLVEIKLDESGNSACIDRKSFEKLDDFIKISLLYKAFSLVGVKKRLPYYFLNDTVEAIKKNCESGTSKNKIFSKAFADYEIILKKEQLLVKKSKNSNTDLIFFDIIKEAGSYEFPFGNLEVLPYKDNLFSFVINAYTVEKKFSLPLCVRNLQAGDKILAADKTYKKIIDIFKDWQVPEELRSQIPLVQNLSGEEEILCILGKGLGFKDWIVK